MQTLRLAVLACLCFASFWASPAHAQVTPPTLTPPTIAATLAPVAGTVTNARVAQVSGQIAGAAAPFSVTFLVDGTIESQINGLAAGEAFQHGITLAVDGARRFSVRARDANGAQATSELGTITLDTTPPAAPILLTMQPIVTNQNLLKLKGVHPEPPRPGNATPGNGGPGPRVLILGPSQVRFTPAQPQAVTDPSGIFETQADLTNLPDGTYSFRLIAIDAVGNFSQSSVSSFKSISRR